MEYLCVCINASVVVNTKIKKILTVLISLFTEKTHRQSRYDLFKNNNDKVYQIDKFLI